MLRPNARNPNKKRVREFLAENGVMLPSVKYTTNVNTLVHASNKMAHRNHGKKPIPWIFYMFKGASIPLNKKKSKALIYLHKTRPDTPARFQHGVARLEANLVHELAHAGYMRRQVQGKKRIYKFVDEILASHLALDYLSRYHLDEYFAEVSNVQPKLLDNPGLIEEPSHFGRVIASAIYDTFILTEARERVFQDLINRGFTNQKQVMNWLLKQIHNHDVKYGSNSPKHRRLEQHIRIGLAQLAT
jgi:hypothetical protein